MTEKEKERMKASGKMLTFRNLGEGLMIFFALFFNISKSEIKIIFKPTVIYLQTSNFAPISSYLGRDGDMHY